LNAIIEREKDGALLLPFCVVGDDCYDRCISTVGEISLFLEFTEKVRVSEVPSSVNIDSIAGEKWIGWLRTDGGPVGAPGDLSCMEGVSWREWVH
jgi:hypothetical protein